MFYHHCQQGTKIVARYVDEFQELGTRNDLNKTELHKVLRFVTGLKEPLRSQVDV